MCDLHTAHLKCFCSFMCPLNVFETYIQNFNRNLFPGGRHTDGRTDRKPTPYVSLPLRGETKIVLCLICDIGENRFVYIETCI